MTAEYRWISAGLQYGSALPNQILLTLTWLKEYGKKEKKLFKESGERGYATEQVTSAVGI